MAQSDKKSKARKRAGATKPAARASTTPTRGAAALHEWRSNHGYSLAHAGEQFGVSAATVMRWERGEDRPRRAVASVIEVIVGIPCGDWQTPAERAAVDAAAARVLAVAS